MSIPYTQQSQTVNMDGISYFQKQCLAHYRKSGMEYSNFYHYNFLKFWRLPAGWERKHAGGLSIGGSQRSLKEALLRFGEMEHKCSFCI